MLGPNFWRIPESPNLMLKGTFAESGGHTYVILEFKNKSTVKAGLDCPKSLFQREPASLV